MLKLLGQYDEKWGIYMVFKCLPTRHLGLQRTTLRCSEETSRHRITLLWWGPLAPRASQQEAPRRAQHASRVSETGTSHNHSLRDYLPNAWPGFKCQDHEGQRRTGELAQTCHRNGTAKRKVGFWTTKRLLMGKQNKFSRFINSFKSLLPSWG